MATSSAEEAERPRVAHHQTASCPEKSERERRERRGEIEGDDVATLTCEAHVDSTRTQLSHRIKSGSIPPEHLK
jgi:hypothetical protein